MDDSQRFPVGGALEEPDEEDRWVERACQGDGVAIGVLYRRYAPAVFRYLFYRLGDPQMAEDLTSEVFVRALEALPRYRRRGLPFSAWLYRIAGARVADYFRQRRRRPTVALHSERGARSEPPEEEVLARMTAEELQRALVRLTDLQQQVIVLRFVEGLSHSEVAAIVGKSEEAVRVLQFRALRALRRLLEPGT